MNLLRLVRTSLLLVGLAIVLSVSMMHPVQAQLPDYYAGVDLSPDEDELLAFGFDGLVHVIDRSTGEIRLPIPNLSGFILTGDWHPDPDELSFATGHQDAPNIRIWSSTTGTLLSSYNYVAGPVYGVQYSPDGTRLAAFISGEISYVIVLNVATYQPLCIEEYGGPALDIAWNHASNMLAVGMQNHFYTISVTSSACNSVYRPYDALARSVAFSPNGSQIAIGDVGRVQLLDVNTFQPIHIYNTVHTDSVYYLSWSDDGSRLISAGGDQRVVVTNLDTGDTEQDYEISQSSPVLALAFSPDGTRILFGDGTEIRDESALPPPPTATPTSTPTATPTVTPTSTPTSTPIPTGTINVGVALEGRSTEPPMDTITGQIFSVVVRQGSTIVLNTLIEAVANGPTADILPIPNLPYGTYTVWVKHPRYLAHITSPIVLNASTVNTSIPALRAGDADNSNLVNISDFSILATSFGKSTGENGFEARADFNADGIVNITDFSLLATNFGQPGPNNSAPLQIGVSAAVVLPPQLASAALELAVSSNRGLAVNSTFSVTVRAGNAGSAASGVTASSIDGAEIHLTFDPAKLRVESITRGSGLTTTLQQTFSNTTGTLDVAYGRLSGTSNNIFTVFTITFRALASTGGTPTLLRTSTNGATPTLLTYRGATKTVTGAPLTVTIP